MNEAHRAKSSYFITQSIVSGKPRLHGPFFPYRCIHEKQYAERQEMQGICFEYESKGFEIELDGKKRHWIPDFYLPETDEYVEINCASNPRKNKKIEAFRKQYPLVKLTILLRPGNRKAKVRHV